MTRLIGLPILILISFAADAATEFSVRENLDGCFRAAGKVNYDFIGYSEATGTLMFEVDQKQTVILKKTAGYQIENAPATACKTVDGKNLDTLVLNMNQMVREHVRDKDIDLRELKKCAEAMRDLGYEDAAILADLAINRRPTVTKNKESATAK